MWWFCSRNVFKIHFLYNIFFFRGKKHKNVAFDGTSSQLTSKVFKRKISFLTELSVPTFDLYKCRNVPHDRINWSEKHRPNKNFRYNEHDTHSLTSDLMNIFQNENHSSEILFFFLFFFQLIDFLTLSYLIFA